MSTNLKVGQTIRNKRSKLVRRITKISKGTVSWTSRDGVIKGKCSAKSLIRWISGKDL